MGLFLYCIFEKSHQMLHLNLLFPMRLLHKDLRRSANAKYRKCFYFSDCSTSLSSLSYFFAIKHFSVLFFLRKLTCNRLCKNFFFRKSQITKQILLDVSNKIALPRECKWYLSFPSLCWKYLIWMPFGVRILLFLYNWNISMHVIPTFRSPNYSLVFDVSVCQAKYAKTYTDIKCYFNIPTIA